jgi:integrase
MTEEELTRLLDVARRRPLLDATTVHRGKRKGQAYAKVRDEVRVRLEAVGRERALIYKTLVLTGLRKNELASLTVAQLRLEGSVPHVELEAADEKSREGNSVTIGLQLVTDLREWLDHKLTSLQAEARRRGAEIPDRLPGDAPVFEVPAGLVRILDRDLKAAGIPKRDERGRTVDVHALRTTFGTLLSKGGVPLRTAQALMRHSDPSLTANVYTDPKLLDVHSAHDTLPNLPLNRGQGQSSGNPPAGPGVDSVAQNVAAPSGKPGQEMATDDKASSPDLSEVGAARIVATGLPVAAKGLLTTPVIACQLIGAAVDGHFLTSRRGRR